MADPAAPRLRRILVTNDDGIDAAGLKVAEEVAAAFADEVWVVAPEHDCSGTSRQVSIHHPLRLFRHGERRFSVAGTPSDCAIMGLRHVLAGKPVDLVQAGVNAGANISRETGYSGTVGAALTALMLGVPAIALSQAWYKRHEIPWDTSRAWLPRAVGKVLALPSWPGPWIANINVPAAAADEITGIAATRQGEGIRLDIDVETRVDRRETNYYWIGFIRDGVEDAPESDVVALRRKQLSVTPVGMAMTHEAGFAALADGFGD